MRYKRDSTHNSRQAPEKKQLQSGKNAFYKLKEHGQAADLEHTIKLAKEVIKNGGADVRSKVFAHKSIIEKARDQENWTVMETYACKLLHFQPSIYSYRAAAEAHKHLQHWPQLEQVVEDFKSYAIHKNASDDVAYAYENLALALREQDNWLKLEIRSREMIGYAKQQKILNQIEHGYSQLCSALEKQANWPQLEKEAGNYFDYAQSISQPEIKMEAVTHWQNALKNQHKWTELKGAAEASIFMILADRERLAPWLDSNYKIFALAEQMIQGQENNGTAPAPTMNISTISNQSSATRAY